MKVFIFAAGPLLRRAAQFLKDGGMEVTRRIGCADVVYVPYGLHLVSRKGLVYAVVFAIRRKPVLVHWVGSDVWHLRNLSIARGWRARVKLSLLRLLPLVTNMVHFAGAQHLCTELEAMRIRARYVVLPYPSVTFNPYPLPANTAALTYVPKGEEDFYGLDVVLQLARDNPDVHFHIVGLDRYPGQPLPNVTCHGVVDGDTMEELYRLSTCVLRITKHDALAGTVLEGVSRGRYAIWSYPSPYSYRAQNAAEAQRALDDIKGKRVPNVSGAQYVDREFGYERTLRQFLAALQGALTHRDGRDES